MSDPAGRLEVARDAVPLLSVFVPRALPFSRKVTVPVGSGPEPVEGATVAVNVTELPMVTLGAEEPTIVEDAAVVTAGFTVNWNPASLNAAPA